MICSFFWPAHCFTVSSRLTELPLFISQATDDAFHRGIALIEINGRPHLSLSLSTDKKQGKWRDSPVYSRWITMSLDAPPSSHVTQWDWAGLFYASIPNVRGDLERNSRRATYSWNIVNENVWGFTEICAAYWSTLVPVSVFQYF